MASMPKLRAVAQYESHHRVCLAGAYLVRLRSVRTPGGLGKPPSLGKGRGCVTGQLDDKVSLGAEMSAADITPTVAWDGLRGYYARASIHDSGQAPSQESMNDRDNTPDAPHRSISHSVDRSTDHPDVQIGA